MKKYLPIAFLFLVILGNAQTPTDKELKKHQEKVAESKEKGKVVLSLDTIFNAGVPYAVLTDKKKAFSSNYTLFSLTGKELVDIPNECVDNPASASKQDCYYAFLFLASGKRGEIQLGLGEKVYEVIVENDLVKNNDINPDGENKFLMKYPPKFSNKSNTTVVVVNNGNVSNTTYQTVDRNRSAAIYLYGTDLSQDFKTIGTITKSNTSVSGKYITTISFFLPNGTKVAEATGEDVNAKEWKVITLKDNQEHHVTTTFAEQEKQIAKYLSDLFYL